MNKQTFSFILLFLPALFFPGLYSQTPDYNAAVIYHKIQKLNVVGRVLYVAAHPDDENTRLITWLSNEKKLETAYISLTRGDGGQNLIGNELGEKLGVIRTNELLQARALDGGTQFFSRARDFGYSKNPDETFMKWDEDIVLSDLVKTIREFKPDIMITRFSLEPGITHGHHTASAMLAVRAFGLSGDERAYPLQVDAYGTWNAKRVLWNTSSFFFKDKDFKKDTFLVLDVGGYNPLLGESYNEIAARSRSQHKSQGFGTPESRGENLEYFSHLAGSKAEKDLFEGLDLSWARVDGGNAIREKIDTLLAAFNFSDPSASVNALVEIYQLIGAMPDNPYKEEKLQDCAELIGLCLGLYLDVAADQSVYCPGDSVHFTLQGLNRSNVPVSLVSAEFNVFGNSFSGSFSQPLSFNQLWMDKTVMGKLQSNAEYSVPFWLEEKGSQGLFRIDDPGLVNEANIPTATWKIMIEVEGMEVLLGGTVVNRRPDPVEAEVISPLSLVPPLAVVTAQESYTFRAGSDLALTLSVRMFKDIQSLNLQALLPEGWIINSPEQVFSNVKKGDVISFSCIIEPPAGSKTADFQIRYNADGTEGLARMMVEIQYPHIPYILYTLPYTLQLTPVDIGNNSLRIGYIPGAGDEVAAVLQNLGYAVSELDPATVTATVLSQYDAVVTGIRAYNTLDNITAIHNALIQYADSGGTVVVQYNTTAGLKIAAPGPYELKIGRERVTVEEAEVEILKPEHPVFHIPNEISNSDFSGWVQERGLYFPGSWDEKYTPLLKMNDPGENATKGSLLVAETGKGNFIYTGLSFFRQLPAGNPGAIRLFVNLLNL